MSLVTRKTVIGGFRLASEAGQRLEILDIETIGSLSRHRAAKALIIPQERTG